LLVVESSPPLRQFLCLHLETAGYQVRLAEDAGEAERLSVQRPPALILVGSGKGGTDCLRVLERLRSVIALATTPAIVVSLRGDAESVDQAQVLGAAGYLTLPVTRDALLNAVRSQLLERGADQRPGLGSPPPGDRGQQEPTGDATDSNRRWQPDVASTVGVGEHVRFMETMGPPTGAPTGIRLAAGPSEARAPTTFASQESRRGTVLFVDIRNFSALAETLSTDEVAELLNSYFVRACEPILQQGGWIVKLLGDGILALFEARNSGPSHAERALKAGLFTCIVAQRFDEWLKRRFPAKQLPDFAVGVGVHTGDVMVCRINTGAGVDTTIIGDTVNVASRVEEQTKKLGASLVTTLDTLALAGSRFILGKRGSLLLRGRASPVEITEITGLRPRPDVDAKGLQTYNVIAEAVVHNTAIIVRERDRVLSEPHRFRPGGVFAPLRPADTPINIPGFKLIRHLGQGGMSRAFLAEYEMTGSERVVKVLSLAEGGYDLLRRFLQEYELISQIRDPHVATIFDSGQTDAHAYIVMEYLPSGDLRRRIEQGVPPAQALDYLRQIAEALVAIHARGIVHRDLKPDTLLLREDGTLVLADFGIAKDLSRTLNQTRHGEVLGTPHYLSPEQANGGKVDPRSDLYSLGVICYEMLTGSKPYTADDAPSVIHKHMHEPVPWLPDELVSFQPMLDRLMAKSPDDRFQTAADALKAIRVLQDRQSG
jgi:class 3 adenylate cyclase/DNA-binding response OmpR family regulator